LAKFAGVSRESVRKARVAGRIVAGPDGTFDLESAAAVLMGGRAGGVSGLPTVAESRQAAEAFKARLAKLEVERQEGKLVVAADVERAWSGIGVQIRDAVMALKSRICNRVPSEWRRELAAVINEEARAILTGLSGKVRGRKQRAGRGVRRRPSKRGARKV
jgi:hypothetical protein